MRLPVWAWLALSSLILCQLAGQTRPHYGGALNVELSTPESVAGTALSVPIAETLVRVNTRGKAEPWLAAPKIEAAQLALGPYWKAKRKLSRYFLGGPWS